MFPTRRRRLAWMLMLVLALELAIVCCASAHLADHVCAGHRHCAICACVRAGLRRAAVAAMLLSALTAMVAIHSGARCSRRTAVPDSPVLLRVRLND